MNLESLVDWKQYLSIQFRSASFSLIFKRFVKSSFIYFFFYFIPKITIGDCNQVARGVKSFSSWKAIFLTSLGLLTKHLAKFPDLIDLSLIFILLNWLIFLLFTNLLTILLLIPRFLANSRGLLWVPGKSSYKQLSSSTNSAFSVVVTVIGRPEPVLLFMNPSSLNHFKIRWTELSTHSFDLCHLHIQYTGHPFSS